jgi:hypothetical protein
MPDSAAITQSALAKRCQCCQEEKSLGEFHRHAGRHDGRDSTCKACNARRGRQWYQQRQRSTNGLYSTWVAMRQRCHYPKHEHFPTYGGRGIHVCPAWRASFEAFRQWASQAGYRPGLQLDRIDNDKGYSPANCRFVTPSENARNKRKRERPLRTNPTLTETQVRQVRALLSSGLSLREIGRRFGVTHGTIWAIKHGRTWTEVT